jgi:acetate kinase
VRVLVLNSGSSSLKFQLIETGLERTLAHGVIEKIGEDDSPVKFEAGGKTDKFTKIIPDHKVAIQAAFDCMTASEGVIGDLQEIAGVGHRVVHGGEHFRQSVLITDDVVREIEAVSELAPLHNPHNLKGYYASRELLPQAQHTAVFDTAFHQTLPPCAYRYALAEEYYTRDRIRRYGFHGTSHRYVSWRYGQIHGTTRDAFKLITCHLGNGCSLCAIDHGKSIDTSMGFTPLEGLVMGTRSGDLDPGAVLYLIEHKQMTAHEVEALLNEQSGLHGLSGLSGDMRGLVEQAGGGNQHAQLAIDVFCYRVKKYIGSYLAALNGADAIVFAGGIGENATQIRAQICESLDSLGVRLDAGKNAGVIGVEQEIGVEGKFPQVWVIPTNEELLIARDTMCCIEGLPHT